MCKCLYWKLTCQFDNSLRQALSNWFWGMGGRVIFPGPTYPTIVCFIANGHSSMIGLVDMHGGCTIENRSQTSAEIFKQFSDSSPIEVTKHYTVAGPVKLAAFPFFFQFFKLNNKNRLKCNKKNAVLLNCGMRQNKSRNGKLKLKLNKILKWKWKWFSVKLKEIGSMLTNDNGK